MPIEIEKKYLLTRFERRAIERRLRELGYQAKPIEFEENTIYQGGSLGFGRRALRIRRVNGSAILTFKERIPTKSPIKHQKENETRVSDAQATHEILLSLGFAPALVYEKRRTRWQVGKATLVIDELPFGLFMEIEASERDIRRVEKLIDGAKLTAVTETYPSLTAKLGKKNRKGIIEARLGKARRRRSEVRDQTSDIRSQTSEVTREVLTGCRRSEADV
jgi:adenylate cyclase class 2